MHVNPWLYVHDAVFVSVVRVMLLRTDRVQAHKPKWTRDDFISKLN